jgi:hypothetical protein
VANEKNEVETWGEGATPLLREFFEIAEAVERKMERLFAPPKPSKG